MGGKGKSPCAPNQVTVCLDRATAENLFFALSVALGQGQQHGKGKGKNGKGGKGGKGKS